MRSYNYLSHIEEYIKQRSHFTLEDFELQFRNTIGRVNKFKSINEETKTLEEGDSYNDKDREAPETDGTNLLLRNTLYLYQIGDGERAGQPLAQEHDSDHSTESRIPMEFLPIDLGTIR